MQFILFFFFLSFLLFLGCQLIYYYYDLYTAADRLLWWWRPDVDEGDAGDDEEEGDWTGVFPIFDLVKIADEEYALVYAALGIFVDDGDDVVATLLFSIECKDIGDEGADMSLLREEVEEHELVDKCLEEVGPEGVLFGRTTTDGWFCNTWWDCGRHFPQLNS